MNKNQRPTFADSLRVTSIVMAMYFLCMTVDYFVVNLLWPIPFWVTPLRVVIEFMVVLLIVNRVAPNFIRTKNNHQ